jgi:hypothetical protein
VEETHRAANKNTSLLLYMDITKLTKRLAALAKKLAAVIKLNCPSPLGKIALEMTNAT